RRSNDPGQSSRRSLRTSTVGSSQKRLDLIVRSELNAIVRSATKVILPGIDLSRPQSVLASGRGELRFIDRQLLRRISLQYLHLRDPDVYLGPFHTGSRVGNSLVAYADISRVQYLPAAFAGCIDVGSRRDHARPVSFALTLPGRDLVEGGRNSFGLPLTVSKN